MKGMFPHSDNAAITVVAMHRGDDQHMRHCVHLAEQTRRQKMAFRISRKYYIDVTNLRDNSYLTIIHAAKRQIIQSASLGTVQPMYRVQKAE